MTSKTHLTLRALRSTYPLYLMIPVSGVLKLKLRTDAQTDRRSKTLDPRATAVSVSVAKETISH